MGNHKTVGHIFSLLILTVAQSNPTILIQSYRQMPVGKIKYVKERC